MATYPELPEATVTQCMPKSRQTLSKNLFAVRNEEQPVARQPRSEACVVDGRHDRFTGARGGNKEVTVEALFAGELDLFEKSFLEGLEPDLDGTERDFQSIALPACREEPVVVVLLEVVLLPVTLEDRADLLDHGAVSPRRRTHVPFETGHLGRVREIGRPNVGRGVSRIPVEQPGLSVKARARRIV